MTLRTYKPYTKSMRGTILVDRTNLWKGKSEKTLTKKIHRAVGRNNQGRITSRHRSAGHKKKYRIIDFKRNKLDVAAEIKRFEHDPFRSANIMLVEYQDKTISYMLAPEGVKIGDKIYSGEKLEILPGNCMKIKDMPSGTSVHNIELTPGKGGVIARSAGTAATIMGTDGDYTTVKLSSGEVRKVRSQCRATIGQLSNIDNKNVKIGKAGRNRWLGIRPQSRGVVMNPVDHPHGGGEGKTSGGRDPVTPWGQGTKGLKTRNNKKTDQFIISRKKKR